VRAAYLLFQDILWDAFAKGDTFKGINWEDPKSWIDFDDHRCLAMLAEDDSVSQKLYFLLGRQLPKMIKEAEITDPNVTRIYRLCQEGSYKKKIECERDLLEGLQSKWGSLKILFLDSPILVPYPPTPFAVDYPYVWNGDPLSEPTAFHKDAMYVRYLAEASEKVRIYVNRVWTSEEEKGEFIKDLNDKILQLKPKEEAVK
jgi:hypothetical protein